MAHKPQRANAVGVVVGHHTLAVEGVGNRDTEFAGKPHQGRGGVRPGGAMPGQHHRPLRAAQDGDCARHLTGCRGVGADDVAGQRRQVATVGGIRIYLLGHSQVNRGRTFGLGDLERLAKHLRYRASSRNAGGPAGDRGEHRHQVDMLVRLLELTVLTDLGGDRHQGRAVAGGVGDTELHVDRARAQGGRDHPRAPGDAPVHLGHEGRALLVPGENIADPRRRQRLYEADVLLPGQPEDDGNPLVFQALDHQLSGCTHPAPPCRPR
jgi:hypothetical protein